MILLPARQIFEKKANPSRPRERASKKLNIRTGVRSDFEESEDGQRGDTARTGGDEASVIEKGISQTEAAIVSLLTYQRSVITWRFNSEKDFSSLFFLILLSSLASRSYDTEQRGWANTCS